MRLLNYFDKRYTLTEQKRFISSFLLFGMPIGYTFSQLIGILLISWDKYHFSYFNLFFTFIFDLLFCSPLIINYIRHIRRYNKIIKRLNYLKPIESESKNKFSVKALYDYRKFKKGESYFINIFDLYKTKLIAPKWKQLRFAKMSDNFIYIENEYDIHFLGEVINKFELNDIKEERRKKLEKLKRRW